MDFKFTGLAGEHADAFDDMGHAVGLFHDQGQPLPQLCGRDVPSALHADEKVLGQAASPDQGLVEFVGDGGRHFAQRSQTVRGYAEHALGGQFAFGRLPRLLGLEIPVTSLHGVDRPGKPVRLVQHRVGRHGKHRSRRRTMAVSLCRLWRTRAIRHSGVRISSGGIFRNHAGFASLHENGNLGPFIESHQPGVKTVFKVNPNWWGKPEHNIKEIIFTPIGSASTRVAALLSGEVDVIEPVPTQDIQRVNAGGNAHRPDRT